MKRKTLLLSVSALALIAGFASGCSIIDDGSSETDGKTDGKTDDGGTDSGEITTPSQTNDIKFTASKTTIEVGESISILIRVSNTTSDATVNVSVDNEEVVELPANVSGVTSVKITGKSAGTVVLKATSVETKNYNTLTITVTAALPAASAILEKYSALENYTFTSSPVSGATNDTTYTLKRVKYGFTLTDGNNDPVFSTSQSTDDSIAGYTYYGIGISMVGDNAGYAGYLQKQVSASDKTEGSLSTTVEMLRTDTGMLDYTNFAGLGSSASSITDTAFTTLANINPKWFTATKSYTNEYEIAGSQDESQLALLECVIWALVDPVGYSSVLYAKYGGQYYFYNAASLVDTKITVTGQDELKFTVTPIDGLKDASGNSYSTAYEGTVSNIGTTSLDAEFTTAITATTTETGGLTLTSPTIASDVLAAKTALDGNNYTITENYSSYNAGSIVQYYTENYWFVDYTQAWNTAMETVYNNAGYNWTTYYPTAYVVESDGYLHKVTFGFDYTITDDAIVTSNSTNLPGTYLYSALGYFCQSYFDLTDSWVYFSDTAAQVWSGSTTQYYTTRSSYIGGMLMYDLGYTSELDKGYTTYKYQTSDGSTGDTGIPYLDDNLTITSQKTKYYITEILSGLNVEKKSGAISKVTFMQGWFVSTTAGVSSNSAFTLSTSYENFGSATENNVNDKLTSKISSSTTTD